MSNSIFTIAVDTQLKRVVAYTDYVEDVNQIELFASGVRKTCFNDFVVVDTTGESIEDCRAVDFDDAKSIMSKLGFNSTAATTFASIAEVIRQACLNDSITYINLEKTKMTEQTTKPAASKAAPKAAPKAAKPKGEANGLPKRPKDGTKTGRVWAIADKNYRKTRADVIGLCVEDGITPATAATQYGNWARARRAEGKQVGPANADAAKKKPEAKTKPAAKPAAATKAA